MFGRTGLGHALRDATIDGMTLRVPISPETEAQLRARAADTGLDIETYAARTLERIASRPPLADLLAPLRAEVEDSGISEDDLTQLLEEAKHESRAARRAHH